MDLAQMQSRGFDETGGEIDEKELLGDHLQPASFARAPRQVYKMLVQNIAEQLGTENKEALVFNQDAPDSLKDDSALKILQHLERKGVFSPHKIDELAELLRAISRHDLVSKFVDPYLQQYGRHYSEPVVKSPKPRRKDDRSLSLPSGVRNFTNMQQLAVEEAQDVQILQSSQAPVDPMLPHQPQSMLCHPSPHGHLPPQRMMTAPQLSSDPPQWRPAFSRSHDLLLGAHDVSSPNAVQCLPGDGMSHQQLDLSPHAAASFPQYFSRTSTPRSPLEDPFHSTHYPPTPSRKPHRGYPTSGFMTASSSAHNILNPTPSSHPSSRMSSRNNSTDYLSHSMSSRNNSTDYLSHFSNGNEWYCDQRSQEMSSQSQNDLGGLDSQMKHFHVSERGAPQLSSDNQSPSLSETLSRRQDHICDKDLKNRSATYPYSHKAHAPSYPPPSYEAVQAGKRRDSSMTLPRIGTVKDSRPFTPPLTMGSKRKKHSSEPGANFHTVSSELHSMPAANCAQMHRNHYSFPSSAAASDSGFDSAPCVQPSSSHNIPRSSTVDSIQPWMSVSNEQLLQPTSPHPHPQPPVAAQTRSSGGEVMTPIKFRESTDNAEGLVEHLSKHQPPKRQGSPTKRIMKLPLSLRSAIRSHEMRWQVKRNDLNKVIYKHKTQKCFTGPDKLELEAQAGKANPKLVFKLYPYGLEGDFGKNATLDVEIDMPKKCRRLPSTAKAKLRISAWDCQEGKTLCCRDNIEIPMNHRQFPIPAFISHEALKLSHSELIEIHVMAELIEGANACFYVTTGDEIYV